MSISGNIWVDFSPFSFSVMINLLFPPSRKVAGLGKTWNSTLSPRPLMILYIHPKMTITPIANAIALCSLSLLVELLKTRLCLFKEFCVYHFGKKKIQNLHIFFNIVIANFSLLKFSNEMRNR